VPTRRELTRDSARDNQEPHHAAPQDRLLELLETALRWRPGTALGYLMVVAAIGILLAIVFIIGVELHLLKRLG
jgi:hypothetical protein